MILNVRRQSSVSHIKLKIYCVIIHFRLTHLVPLSCRQCFEQGLVLVLKTTLMIIISSD